MHNTALRVRSARWSIEVVIFTVQETDLDVPDASGQSHGQSWLTITLDAIGPSLAFVTSMLLQDGCQFV